MLSPNMWSVEAIESVWHRQDQLSVEHLLEFENVREWVNSSESRATSLVTLLGQAKSDLDSWNVENLGIFPSGVGGITVAARGENGDCVGKWMVDGEALDLRVLSAQLLSQSRLGPEVLAVSRHGFLSRRVVPGTPIRSLMPSPSDVLDAVKLLAQLNEVPLPAGRKLPSLTEITLLEIDACGKDGVSNPFWSTLRHLNRRNLPTRPACFSHGDLQLGNVLVDENRLLLIDGLASVDEGYFDIARLVLHTFVDAAGRGEEWDLVNLLEVTSRAYGTTPRSVRPYAQMRAALDGYRLFSRGLREWEWRGYQLALDALGQ